MKVQAITVDLWGTLLLDSPISDDENYRRRRMSDFEAILRGAGITVRPAQLDAAYAPVRKIADDADGEGAALRLTDLIDRWRDLRDTRWPDLATFLEGRPDLTSGSWYSALRDAVQAVEADVARQARRPLAQRSVFDLGTALSHATATARNDLSRALDEVMRLSERTVGQLPAV